VRAVLSAGSGDVSHFVLSPAALITAKQLWKKAKISRLFNIGTIRVVEMFHGG
jgi:hypothetical protein